MKRLTISILALAMAASLFAAEEKSPFAGTRAEKLIKDNLPICSVDAKVKEVKLQHKLPYNMVGSVVQIESDRNPCTGQWVTIMTNEGGFFMGIPWFLDGEKTTADEKPKTLEEKLKDYAWNMTQQNATPIIDRTKTRDGLYRVTLEETTEAGKMPLLGEIDPAGTVFFIGHFLPLSGDIREERLKRFEPYLSEAPATGSAKPVVTVIEFSDFECPSCQRASGFMKPIMEKYSDKVRYIRYDLPLVSMHPWAFSAAVAGRAIYKQKPELFWTYKEQIYKNQESLSAFTIDDFARGFAQDHDLNMKQYDADLKDPAMRETLLKGVGAAFSNDVRATPTYVVNGVTVDAGDGKALETYVASQLKSAPTKAAAK